ncbi:MAG: aminotransferase class V-fold PLP-dependent enzyme [Maricaulaceae bacterium]|jgi:selenocysteine lyase/cysteine desulfurase
MSYKRLFSRSINASPARLHAAAHSHHLWPDAAFEGHAEAADDAARLADRKWDKVTDEIVPAARAEVAAELNVGNGDTIAFAPNTHEFVVRLRSCFPADKPVRILTTDGEFHSFSRQLARWEEAESVVATRVPVEPFDSFADRILEAIAAEPFDWVFVSHVFFASGCVFDRLNDLAAALGDRPDCLVIDGYHGFMAIETDFAPIASRAFYLAGGYKYAMSGEGVCFLHAPRGFCPRPENTGWFAAFDALEAEQDGRVGYAETAARFAGATYDPSGLYRFLAVRRMLAAEGLTTARISAHVRPLLDQLAEEIAAGRAGHLADAELLAVRGDGPAARFLAYRHPDAPEWTRRLAEAGIVTDARGDVIRFGLGLYHDPEDVDRLVETCATACG